MRLEIRRFAPAAAAAYLRTAPESLLCVGIFPRSAADGAADIAAVLTGSKERGRGSASTVRAQDRKAQMYT